MKDIVIIGAGNVGWHLGNELYSNGFNIVQVYNRTESKALKLAKKVEAKSTKHLGRIVSNADLYIIAVSDDIINEIALKLKNRIKTGLVVHTSGTNSFKILNPYFKRTGNFYPLQTFSKKRKVNFSNIPIFIQGRLKKDRDLLLKLGQKLSNNTRLLKDSQKAPLHLSAVIANNFTNHLLGQAKTILEANDLPFDVLTPLIYETIAKLTEMDPKKAQTGPAKRGDFEVIQKHLPLLKGEDAKLLYKLISTSINPKLKNKL
jgi:predicted short-subunit dehydrogenase-like oxidoreductase (DUF2520 family)